MMIIPAGGRFRHSLIAQTRKSVYPRNGNLVLVGVRSSSSRPPTNNSNTDTTTRTSPTTRTSIPTTTSTAGFFDNIADSLNAFRLRAADALTSSLPQEERKKLLEKFQPKTLEKQSDNSTKEKEEENAATAPQQRSIDEAVAAARAQEAAANALKFEKEREQLMKEAEEAARKRVESDISIQRQKIAFDAWKNQVQREQAKLSNTTNTKNTTNTTNADNEKFDEHPVLGRVLLDLGHKRIYVADAEKLASIPVWKKQRIYRHNRAEAMAKDKIKTLHLGLPGIIGIFEAKDGSLSIIDGQHRIGMLRVLQNGKAKENDFDFGRILVEVYTTRDDLDEDSHANELFVEVNKAQPVKSIDLPGAVITKHRNIINEGATLLQEKFSEMFKPSQRCRPPHLNIDNLRDLLFRSGVFDRHSFNTPKDLEAWLLEQNKLMSERFQNPEIQKLVNEAALDKAIKFDFYLGLDSSWANN